MKRLYIAVLILVLAIPVWSQTVNKEPQRVRTAEMDLIGSIGTLASAQATLKMDAIYFNTMVPGSVLNALATAMKNPSKEISAQRMQAQKYLIDRNPWAYHNEIVNSLVPLAITEELRADIDQATKIVEQYNNINELLTLANKKLGESRPVYRFVSSIINDYLTNNLSDARFDYWYSTLTSY